MSKNFESFEFCPEVKDVSKVHVAFMNTDGVFRT